MIGNKIKALKKTIPPVLFLFAALGSLTAFGVFNTEFALADDRPQPPNFGVSGTLDSAQNTLTVRAANVFTSGYVNHFGNPCGATTEHFYITDSYRMDGGGTISVGGLSKSVSSSQIVQTSSGTVFSCPGAGEPGTFSFTDTINVSSLPNGTYTLSLRLCTVSGVCSTATTNVNINRGTSNPNFSLSASPSTRTIEQGQSTTYTVSASCSGGFAGPVGSLSVTNLHSGATASWSGGSISCGGSRTLTINTSSNAQPGTRTLTVSGSGSGVGTRSDTADLTIEGVGIGEGFLCRFNITSNISTGAFMQGPGGQTQTLSGTSFTFDRWDDGSPMTQSGTYALYVQSDPAFLGGWHSPNIAPPNVDAGWANYVCNTSAGDDTKDIIVTYQPPGESVPTVDIKANGSNGPITVGAGNSVTLSWDTTNSPTSCSASGAWSGSKSVSGGSQSTGALSGPATRTYTITCSNGAGSDSDSVTVNVNAPVAGAPTVDIKANNSNGPIMISDGGSANLSWTITNSPTSCSASGAWSGSKSVSGGSQSTGALSGPSTRTYTITCSNSSGSASDSVTIEVDGTTSGFPNDSLCIGINAPDQVVAGSSFSASVTMENVGTDNWTTGTTPHRLGAQSPRDNTRWGLSRVNLPSSPISPGQQVTFNFTATAPTFPSTYDFDWRMLEETVQWFGEYCVKDIQVVDSLPGTVNVNSNMATTWSLSGPTPQNQNTAVTSRAYSSQEPGSYTLSPASIDGHTMSISPGSSQSLSNGGSITFNVTYTALKQCEDGVDNDGDGLVDSDDPGCTPGGDDDDDEDPNNPPGCSDNLDNDGDGEIDFPNDPGCDSNDDLDESNDAPGPDSGGPDFTLSSSNNISIDKNAGETTSDTTNLRVHPIDGFSSDVTLSILSGPSVTYNFSDETLSASEYSSGSAMSVTIDPSFQRGNYPIVVQGKGAGLTRTRTVILSVDESGPVFEEF